MSAEQSPEGLPEYINFDDLSEFDGEVSELHLAVEAYDDAQVSYLAACEAFIEDPNGDAATEMEAQKEKIASAFEYTIGTIWQAEPDNKERVKMTATIMYNEERARKLKMRTAVGCKKYQTYASSETEYAELMLQAMEAHSDPEDYKDVIVESFKDDIKWDFRHLRKKHMSTEVETEETKTPKDKATEAADPAVRMAVLSDTLGAYVMRGANIGSEIGKGVGVTLGAALGTAALVKAALGNLITQARNKF